MGVWNSHGMNADTEECEYALSILGMIPEEVMHLADYAERERWVCEQMKKSKKGQEKRKLTLIENHWKRRCRKWKELAAALEREISEQMEDGDATQSLFEGEQEGSSSNA